MDFPVFLEHFWLHWQLSRFPWELFQTRAHLNGKFWYQKNVLYYPTQQYTAVHQQISIRDIWDVHYSDHLNLQSSDMTTKLIRYSDHEFCLVLEWSGIQVVNRPRPWPKYQMIVQYFGCKGRLSFRHRFFSAILIRRDYVLCISTSKRVLHTPFPGRNHLCLH